jgi:hypothetical protein
MVFTFDRLGYAKRLRDSRISQDHAEAHVEAARDFIMAELVTKADLDSAIDGVDARIDNLESDLESEIETLGLRLTVRLGAMLAAGIALLAAVPKMS